MKYLEYHRIYLFWIPVQINSYMCVHSSEAAAFPKNCFAGILGVMAAAHACTVA
jgi:hypothetical protein